jgi:hypothetical protein
MSSIVVVSDPPQFDPEVGLTVLLCTRGPYSTYSINRYSTFFL